MNRIPLVEFSRLVEPFPAVEVAIGRDGKCFGQPGNFHVRRATARRRMAAGASHPDDILVVKEDRSKEISLKANNVYSILALFKGIITRTAH